MEFLYSVQCTGEHIMEIENDWASPTIGDIRLPDRDLGRRLARQPDVEMRAKMLGLDWTTLTAAHARLLQGAWLISATVALLALAANFGHADLTLTAVVVAIAITASMLALRTVSRFRSEIARNDVRTAMHYRMFAMLAPSRSLLGYRVRFILVRHSIITVVTVAIVALMARGL
jgi:hypothetical protein